jgi:hypothetical protein
MGTDSVLADVLKAAGKQGDGDVEATPETSPGGGSEAVADALADVTLAAGAAPAVDGGTGAEDGPGDAADPAAPEPAAVRPRDPSGRFAKAEKATVPAPVAKEPKPEPSVTPQPKPAAEKPTATPAPKPGAESVALRAPQSWKPMAKERWAQLPAEVQQEVFRVDREHQRVMQEAAESRKFHQTFRETVAPFEAMIRAEGGEPIAAVRELLQTAAALRMAPAPHKAKLVAKMIQTFGIDVQALDAELAGEAAPQGMPQAQQPGQFRDPRVDQLLATLQERQVHSQRTAAEQRAQEVAKFAETHEFYEDVREQMADVIELHSKRGSTLSLDQAYTLALKLLPDDSEVAQVLRQRAEAKAVTATQAATQRARAAASSVKSEPTSPIGAKAPGERSIFEEVRAQAARLQGR